LAAYRGDVHPNAKGHAMIFRNLYARLSAQPDAWKILTGTGAKESAAVSERSPVR
jgi:hypothetical protein